MAATTSPLDFGERVDGIDIPVFNERAVRASAGLLFLVGMVAFMTAALTDNFDPLRAFAFIFMVDMMLRLFVSARYTPSMFLGALMVRRQRPEWVGADQKKLAWTLGLGLAFTSCVAMGLLGLDETVTLILCGLCLGILFLETAFGICVGCSLYRIFARTKPQLCPGDTCTYVPLTRAEKRAQSLTQISLDRNTNQPEQ
ncbi:DUF4395 domain-containing protein [Cryobacterium frigoriphilum]|uniref:DUF4395 domain-containing protein n=1 Tax=Cryobacterium frigoriphilum TaxID=1259150 RepID=A0A4R9AAN0_9MICO|nr:DUF4395 domain-containing protein [Cryobacterium frigoriphilum]TFD54429.1 DUF4395 domain-containing protein [Cryobacterium frigoriphilum]